MLKHFLRCSPRPFVVIKLKTSGIPALAVVAERPDLITRLFGTFDNNNPYGMVQVNLFVDGFWTKITLDNFLPCMIDNDAEDQLQQALKASLGLSTSTFQGPGYTLSGSSASAVKNSESNEDDKNNENDFESSKFDPFVLTNKTRQVLANTRQYLREQQTTPTNPYAKKSSSIEGWHDFVKNSPAALSTIPPNLHRAVATDDLAYSKAKHQQLWVPFLVG